MVTKLLSKSGHDGLPKSAGTMGQTLAKALGELPEYLHGQSIVHPHHICIELDDMAKQSIGELLLSLFFAIQFANETVQM